MLKNHTSFLGNLDTITTSKFLFKHPHGMFIFLLTSIECKKPSFGFYLLNYYFGIPSSIERLNPLYRWFKINFFIFTTISVI